MCCPFFLFFKNLYERDDTTDMESPKTGTVDEAPGAAFTSEKFKIQLKNLPRSSNVAEIRTIIKKSKARPVKVFPCTLDDV